MDKKRQKISGETEKCPKAIIIVEHNGTLKNPAEVVILVVREDEIDSKIATLLNFPEPWPHYPHYPPKELVNWMQHQDREKYNVKGGMKFYFHITKTIHVYTDDEDDVFTDDPDDDDDDSTDD